jgi:Mannose-1-phosphate guanylyltransferase
MIRQTVDRILPLIPIENIFIVTLHRYAEETLVHLPELSEDNLILEPEGKNTAPAIALGTLKIKKRDSDPDVVTAVFPADHAIGRDDTFREVIVFGNNVANTRLPNGNFPLVTLGVKPTRPETGYGYIEAAEVVKKSKKYQARKVAKFTEKPDFQTASEFLERGGYYWNSGVFIWRVASILEEFSKYLPEWHKHFDRALDKNRYSRRELRNWRILQTYRFRPYR